MNSLIKNYLRKTSFFILFSLFFSFCAVAQNKTISGKITDDDKESLPGVSVMIKGTNTGTISDIEGVYKLAVPNNAVLVFSYVGFKTQEIAVGDQTNIDFQMESDQLSLSEVVVIGSRNSNRTKLETTVPVDVIQMADIMKAIPQPDLNSILTYLAPSFQSNKQTVSDGTDHIDPASLRGLGPDQVLVLVNGKRRHNSSLVNVNGTVGRGSVGTDLNTIPVSSIERIEVLRDGAAAQYGSDAIAGVINLVLKKQTDQLNTSVTSGANKVGDGALVQFNMNYGFKIGEKGYVNVSGDVSQRGYTNRAEAWTGPIYFGSGLTYADEANRAKDDAEIAKRGLTRDDFRLRAGNSQLRNASLFFNAALPLGNSGAELYAFGGLNQRRGVAGGIFRMPNQTSQVVASMYPNGFLPLINSNIVDKSFAMGVRGKIKDWDVDFSNTYGTNSFMFSVDNSNNASLGAESPTSFQCGGFAFTQNTTNFDVKRYFDKVLSGFNVAFGAEFRVDNYEIFAGEEKSYRNYGLRDIVNVKTVTRPDGTSFNYNEVVGQYDALGKVGGAQVFPGFKPSNEVNKYRTNAAAYIDLEADITKKFTIGVAARYENYSDFGGTLNGKLTTRITLAEGYAIRGAVSTGFRAPSLQQSYFSAVSTLFIGGAPFETGTFTNDSRAAQILGIPKLKQETSVNASLGITAEPVKGLTLSVDGYYIKINDRVLLTGQFRGNATAAVGSQDRTINDLLFSVGANTGQFFTNAINTTTMGLDVVAAQKFDIGQGNLDVSLAANFNKTTVGDDIKTTDLLKGKESNYFDREQKAVFETGNPQNKINLTFTYKINKFSIMLRNVRFGEITYRHPSDGGDPSTYVLNTFSGQKESRDQTFSAKIVTDLTISYQIAKNMGLTIGANNLLDVYPDRNAHSDNASSGRFPYSRRITQFGFNGAYYFGRLSFSL